MMPSETMHLHGPLMRAISAIEDIRVAVLTRAHQAPIFGPKHLHELGDLLARCGDFQGHLVSMLGTCDSSEVRQ